MTRVQTFMFETFKQDSNPQSLVSQSGSLTTRLSMVRQVYSHNYLANNIAEGKVTRKNR